MWLYLQVFDNTQQRIIYVDPERKLRRSSFEDLDVYIHNLM